MFGYHGDLSEEAENLLRQFENSMQSSAAAVAEHLKTVAANGGEQAEDKYLVQEARILAEKANTFADQLEEKTQS